MAKESLLPHQLKLLKSITPVTVMMGGRGIGKSQAASRLILKKIAEGKSCLVSGPTYKQLKHVLFRGIQDAFDLHNVPNDLNKADMTFTTRVGGRTQYIYGTSASTYEDARGYTNITTLVMDEAALHTRECFEVLLACCRGQGPPEVYLLTTPKGSSNWTSSIIQDPNVTVIRAGTRDNFFLAPEYIKLLESQYSGDFLRQEIYGEIVDSITQALLSKADLDACCNNIPYAGEDGAWMKVAGLDVGRSLGGDPSVLVSRTGRNFQDCFKWQERDSMRLAEQVWAKCLELRIERLIVDETGLGGPVVDRLRQLWPGHVFGINFGSHSSDTRYRNERARIWMTMAQKIKAGVHFPDRELFEDPLEDLQYTEYFHTSTGALQLESKDTVKSKLGRSTDAGDACALTYAHPDMPRISVTNDYQTSWRPVTGAHGWMG